MLDFAPESVVQALKQYLDNEYRLYLLSGPAVAGVKYQCCLTYDEILIHVKIFRGDEGSHEAWHAVLSFHRHDTGHPPLPE